MKIIFTKAGLIQTATECGKKKKFSPGFDKMPLESVPTWLEVNGDKLCRELTRATYSPMPATGFNVAKFDGTYRKLAKLTAIDTVIQTSLLEQIQDECDKSFSDFSFAYRRGRGTGEALQKYCEIASDYEFAAKIDIKHFFDNVDFDILENNISALFRNQKLTKLVMSEIKMGLVEDGIFTDRKKGILQGAPLSGLISNIYLTPADRYLESEGVPFVRYADDAVLFAKTEDKLDSAVSLFSKFIGSSLRLELNGKKTKKMQSERIVFLGHKFCRDKEGQVQLSSCEATAPVFYDWYRNRPFNSHSSVDILSDGILRQKDFSAIFSTEGGDTSIPLETVSRINIFSNVIFDSGFLDKALEAGVYINVFRRDYTFVGRFTPFTSLKNQILIFEQINAYNNEKKRLELAKQFVLASIHNLRLNIRYYNKQNENPLYERALTEIDNAFYRIKLCNTYENLLMLEATARRLYYSCFDLFIKDSGFSFVTRSRRPPLNEVNSMISFGNTVLYNYIATELYKSSLDVRVGYLHATNSRMESLNLDIAEIFRPLVVDRVVFTLINKGIISHRHFEAEQNGAVYLNEEGKRIFLRAFYDKMSITLKIGSGYQSYSMLVLEEIQKLTRYFRAGEKYKAYRQVR